MRLALILAIVLLLCGCVQQQYYENSTSVDSDVCRDLCMKHSVFSYSVATPYDRERQISTVVRQDYLDKLDIGIIALDGCNGSAEQNLYCLFVGDEIKYALTGGVCYSYDTILLPRLEGDVSRIRSAISTVRPVDMS